MKKKIIIISFLGEFGYELLNWQAKVRRLHERLIENNERDKYFIVIGSRNGLNNFYENCDFFFELSNFECYNSTIANNYTFDGVINFELFEKDIFDFLQHNCKYIENSNYNLNEISFFWSHHKNLIYGVDFNHDTIYQNCDVKINKFQKIEPDLSCLNEICNQLEFDLTKEDFIYIQSGFRDIVTRSKKIINFDYIFDKISNNNCKIVIANFFTNRSNDTLTRYGNIEKQIINVTNFKTQSCLIYFAKKNIFFSEGDFRSHNYVPPFLGKDVYSVAYDDVFNIGTTPIDYWNNNLFVFGGKIIPVVLNDNIDSYEQILKIINE